LALASGLRGPNAVATSALYPVADRYEPGDMATLVGYAGRGGQGWLEDGPFYAYLAPSVGGLGPTGPKYSGLGGPNAVDGLALGPLSVDLTGHEGWRALRVSISFPVPDDLEPGVYDVGYCNDPCSTGLGDLPGGVVGVGVDPPE